MAMLPYRLRDALDDRTALERLVAVSGAAVLVATAPAAVLGDASIVAAAYMTACLALLIATAYGLHRRLLEVGG